MISDNKLGITDRVELARVEEKLSKAQAHKLFTSGFFDDKTAGSLQTLAAIHTFLFGEIDDFAGHGTQPDKRRRNKSITQTGINQPNTQQRHLHERH